MALLLDQPFLALAAFAMTLFIVALGYVSITDRDPKDEVASAE